MKADFSPIELAHAAPFSLGAIEVRPATREVAARGVSEALQPRIMQVLVALGARAGEVVSRDELIRLCWGRQAVGDDSINRCIAKLRQLGEAHGAFEIVTIARVGYRLDARLAAAPAARRDATPVLAVLPFENLSSDAEMQFFSDGVSEEILAAVSRVAGLRVIGSTSSFSFRGARKAEAAQTLAATHVLDGSVRRSGSRVRVAAQLTEAGSGQVLWSERYDREVTDVLALQDEIAALTATALSARLTSFSPKPSLDPQAYDLYLRAISVRKRFETDAQEKAIAYLRAALAIEPSFARAQAALAMTLCHRILAATTLLAPVGAFDAAVAAVRREGQRALSLDPGDAEARAALLSLKPVVGNWRAHARGLEDALAAAPQDLLLLLGKGRFLLATGHVRAGLSGLREGYHADPLSPFWQMMEAYCLSLVAGDTAAGVAFVRRLFEADRLDPLTWRMAFFFAVLTGAWSDGALLLSRPPVDFTEGRIALAQQSIDVRSGAQPLDADLYAVTQQNVLRSSPFAALIAVSACAQVGLVDEAFEGLDLAMRLHPPEQLWSQWNLETANTGGTSILFVPGAERMRADARFLPLCARLGLCAYWSETGSWPDFIADAPNRGELEARVRELAADGA